MNLRKIARQLIENIVPPLLLFVVVIAIWQACVVGYRLKPYLLPSPVAVGLAFYNDRVLLVRAISPVTTAESSPPDKNAPTGTSATTCARMVSSSLARNSCVNSSCVTHGFVSAGMERKLQAERMSSRPARKVAHSPGRRLNTPR